ncbi:MAG: hypothetical protein LBI48_02405 [Burkholderiaceae bacterium]|jgi:hypothetical protein|nr:hypothetical protein [Burkholderiaceae bacterium]
MNMNPTILNVNPAQLKKAVEDLRDMLGDGLIATDIWDRFTGMALASYDTRPEAVALLNFVTYELAEALNKAKFPGLSRYYLIDLEDDTSALLIQHGKDLFQGMLLSNQKVNLGVVFSMVIPKMLASVASARG